jgi:Domain of unknown function (DUF6457)
MENEWLTTVRAELERACGVRLELSRDEIDELLRLASFAAHESGAKLNAPLVCYLAGRVTAAGGLTVAETAAAVRAAAPATSP